MKYPQVLTVLACIIFGGLFSQVKQDMPVQASAVVKKSDGTGVKKDTVDILKDMFADQDKWVEAQRRDKTVKHVLDGESFCKCGDNCECKRSELAELQAKYDAMVKERDTLQASFKAAGNGSTGGGSTGKPKVSMATSYSYETVTSTKSSSGGSTGSTVRHPVANTAKAAANLAKNTVQTATNVATAPVRAYKARWSHPGSIVTHMETDHGVSCSGFTEDELLAQHDAIHDQIGPRYSTSTRSSSTTSYSSCPGGVCPTANASSRSPGLLGRVFMSIGRGR
jgi:hypothetical protein